MVVLSRQPQAKRTLSWTPLVTKQDPMQPSQNSLPSPMSPAGLLSVEKLQSKIKFNQRSGGKNAKAKENSQTGPNSNSLAIKQSQGSLVPPQGLHIIF